MSRAVGAMLALVAMFAGAFAGECLSRTLVVHRLAGRLFGRGELLAMVGRRGIFQADARALAAEKQWRAPAASVDETVLRAELTANEALRISAAGCDTPRLECVMFPLRAQFGSERAFAAGLRASGISERQLRQMTTETVRGEQWIEQKLAGQLKVFPAEAQR